jgi:release factor glutamine methyltransferase
MQFFVKTLAVSCAFAGRYSAFSVISGSAVPRTFKAAHRWAVEYLTAQQVPDAESSARFLISDVAKTGNRLSDFQRAVDATPSLSLSEQQQQQLSRYCAQRAERMPVQYIIGNWDFFGLELECRPPVLIPRPETEELVERILSSWTLATPRRILDVGAGTGAIGLALLSQMKNSSCVAIDLSADAVGLARRNAQAVLPAHSSSQYSCLHTSFADYCASGGGRGQFDVVVSNPPYIPQDEMLELEPEVAQYEDRRALYGGSDGLDVVRELLQDAGALLKAPGCEMWLEVARRHPDMIEQLLAGQGAPRWRVQEKIIDLAGNPRFVRLSWLG